MNKRLAFMALPIILAFGGCSSDDKDSTDSTTTTSTTVATSTSMTWPPKVTGVAAERTALPDCGQYDASNALAHGLLPANEQKMFDCFWRAYDEGKSAELRVITAMIDTPAVPTYYRIVSKGKYETIVVTPEGTSAARSCPAFTKVDLYAPLCG